MAKRKNTEPNITEPVVEEPATITEEAVNVVEIPGEVEVLDPITSPTVTESPEIITPEEGIETPEPEVTVPEPEPEPTPEPEKAEAVKVNKEHIQRCTMTLLPGGKYQVTLDGVKNLGKWGKEKAEFICNQYNN